MVVEVHKDDVGTIFELTLKDSGVVVDLSSQTLLQIIFERPDGTTVEQTAVFVSDGLDGKIKYVSVANDLDVTGMWKMQGKVAITVGIFRTSTHEFRVHENLGSV